MGKDVIIALDYPNRESALRFLDRFSAEKPFVKIGMELYYATGPDMVREIKARGHRIFLDLKIHDIPNTAAGAVRSISRLGVDMINLHAAGGMAMMKAAADALKDVPGPAPRLIAVTILTSLNQDALEQELWLPRALTDTVLHYGQNAREAGLDGVVCSPLEAGSIHAHIGADFLTVTPGVRFESKDTGDQQRVTTPARARELGSDYIVVGRPITQAEDPVAAYKRCVNDFVTK